MSIAKQLYELQEIDLELDSTEQSIRQITRQLGESEALVGARSKLASERQLLEELRKQQRAAEYEIDDLTGKLKKAEEELYSGRIRNPKELSNLQHEVELVKAQRSQLDPKVLGIMDQAEKATVSVNDAEKKFEAVETEWRQQQKQLSVDLERLKVVLADIKQKRQQLASGIEATALATYQDIKRARGKGVVKVERGICGGCTITLPANELRNCRGGTLVRCGSCGRILYLA